MALNKETTITTNGATNIGRISVVDQGARNNMRIYVSGTFDGGTMIIQSSPDGGTTKFDEKDLSGSVYSITAQDSFDLSPVPAGDHICQDIEYYAVLSGAGSPSITVRFYAERVL